MPATSLPGRGWDVFFPAVSAILGAEDHPRRRWHLPSRCQPLPPQVPLSTCGHAKNSPAGTVGFGESLSVTIVTGCYRRRCSPSLSSPRRITEPRFNGRDRPIRRAASMTRIVGSFCADRSCPRRCCVHKAVGLPMAHRTWSGPSPDWRTQLTERGARVADCGEADDYRSPATWRRGWWWRVCSHAGGACPSGPDMHAWRSACARVGQESRC